jgi:hypothetical protein
LRISTLTEVTTVIKDSDQRGYPQGKPGRQGDQPD